MNIKDDLVRHHHWLRQYGLNDSHSGSASVREDDSFWITPDDCCSDTLTSGDLVECTLGGHLDRRASPDAPLHLAILRANPQLAAILHSHGPYTVAMTMDIQ
ncbi:MAG: class II aldolase/adducin family protein, partial [Candidatus Competibacteraceae bacterium]|nr:class II aldolase/adducin family protein [Candidatus Competibacteraceae bacterium]